jgi:hypothetical protein
MEVNGGVAMCQRVIPRQCFQCDLDLGVFFRIVWKFATL